MHIKTDRRTFLALLGVASAALYARPAQAAPPSPTAAATPRCFYGYGPIEPPVRPRSAAIIYIN